MEEASSASPLNIPTTDAKVWATFQQNFGQVQFLLDHNRLLVKEINQNHESNLAECLNRNSTLTRELNGNMGKVVALYGGLSTSFVDAFESPHQGDSRATPNSDRETVKFSTYQGQKKGRPSLDQGRMWCMRRY
ncbi:hypothetical protein O6H91_03G052600 [Diphasiastrum complanatum]|uniref:Uncharacterized protein n=5 Tax=Diphasiastrum complanatum TaxID=34168 RepID=A0ACC2E6L5_DIPCM|nr:hypothetical protein O6H91_03G052600 [Diphasiastrum complanatum]KAJ7562027.1 hypothetical protein O6H91_03G052600 [Diphasiastrum complanatum]KAJ7562028.1 hypothetical protein O6H91_03G052600 [Diphasiastrum complanatum]KAJ7562029.1 hypothetical protein O6H91_03G052600 [Diphasiastrum complanatum]KAJ7562030.1 hypothetical protein O6H91_03G052600 [Diphasiastrum complanatum]